MRKLNNKGFTLIELVGTVIILSMLIAFGAYTVTDLIKKTKEKNYQLMITEIKSAMEVYYQECQYFSDTCGNEGIITLENLIGFGFLKGNSTIESGPDVGRVILLNPKNNENIGGCEIKYIYNEGNIIIEAITGGSCPTEY